MVDATPGLAGMKWVAKYRGIFSGNNDLSLFLIKGDVVVVVCRRSPKAASGLRLATYLRLSFAHVTRIHTRAYIFTDRIRYFVAHI